MACDKISANVMKKTPPSSQAGFTLVEVVVTIVVSGLFIYASTLALQRMAYINEQAEDLTIANATAQNVVERIRSAGYLTLDDGTTDITSQLPGELLAPRNASYTVSTESPGLKKLDVDVAFTIQGKLQQHSYSSFVGEVGVGQY